MNFTASPVKTVSGYLGPEDDWGTWINHGRKTPEGFGHCLSFFRIAPFLIILRFI